MQGAFWQGGCGDQAVGERFGGGGGFGGGSEVEARALAFHYGIRLNDGAAIRRTGRDSVRLSGDFSAAPRHDSTEIMRTGAGFWDARSGAEWISRRCFPVLNPKVCIITLYGHCEVVGGRLVSGYHRSSVNGRLQIELRRINR